MGGEICQPVCQIENRKNDWKNDSGNHINSFRPRWRQLVLGKPPVDTRRTAGVGNKLFFSIFIGSFISENHTPYFSKIELNTTIKIHNPGLNVLFVTKSITQSLSSIHTYPFPEFVASFVSCPIAPSAALEAAISLFSGS